MNSAAGSPRRRLDGVRMILRYNWPLYLAGLGTVAAGTAIAGRSRRPLTRAAGSLAAVGAGWLAVASLVSTWWIYDRSELYRWTWLRRAVPEAPQRVLVVHAGLDEATGPVRRTWPAAEVTTIDVHGGTGTTTASLRRARSALAPATSGTVAEPGFDVAIAFLAAHEIRCGQGRVEMLGAVASRVRVGGRLVVVEHVRDLANALAYGPAVVHFYPVREWRRALRAAGVDLLDEERITPFVVLLTASTPR